MVQYRDEVVGTGPHPVPGKKVVVAYEGRLGVSGKLFDSSDRFAFRLGVGEVIRGWDLGVEGMRVGGKRHLVLHPKVAYGGRGAPPDIPPHATLTFAVTLLSATA